MCSLCCLILAYTPLFGNIQVFRMIDRADYMTFNNDEDDRLEAYEDHAWRKGTLHLSAPCIYTRALEALKLNKGTLNHSLFVINSRFIIICTLLCCGLTGGNNESDGVLSIDKLKMRI